jgi:hypothetical protein
MLFTPSPSSLFHRGLHIEGPMDGIIYLVGLVVIVMFILSVLGLR